LAVYNFDGSSGASSSENVNLTASTLTAAPGITGGSGGSALNGYSTATPVNSGSAVATSPVRFVRATADSTTIGAAVTNGDYFSFSLTPADGFQLDLESITIDLSVNGTTTSSNTASYAFSSAVGGLGTLASNTVSLTAPGASAINYTRNTFTFSDPGLTNITSATEFRLFVSNSLVNDGAIARFDNIIINGSLTAVPEPSVTMLGTLGVLGLLRRRRA
jgi:hypothetical protein